MIYEYKNTRSGLRESVDADSIVRIYQRDRDDNYAVLVVAEGQGVCEIATEDTYDEAMIRWVIARFEAHCAANIIKKLVDALPGLLQHTDDWTAFLEAYEAARRERNPTPLEWTEKATAAHEPPEEETVQ